MSPIQDNLCQSKLCAEEQGNRRRFNWASGTSAVGGNGARHALERPPRQTASPCRAAPSGAWLLTGEGHSPGGARGGGSPRRSDR